MLPKGKNITSGMNEHDRVTFRAELGALMNNGAFRRLEELFAEHIGHVEKSRNLIRANPNSTDYMGSIIQKVIDHNAEVQRANVYREILEWVKDGMNVCDDELK